MVKIVKFSHDRNAAFDQSCDALRDVIDAFVDQPELDVWYEYFENRYALPKDVIRQQTKKYLEGLYDYEKSIFSEKLFLKKSPLMLIRHIGFLLFAFFASRKSVKTIDTYDLIIEWVASDVELLRFSKLINLFGKENVLVSTVNPAIGSDCKMLYRPSCKFYDRGKVAHAFYQEIIHGLKLHLGLSIKLKVDLIPVVSHIINQYLYYSSLFEHNRSKFCIQERHYQTSAIKNFLFREYGGKFSTSIQKNIHPLGSCGFYYDSDVLFSLGKKTTERAFRYGARIKQVVPVGSMFMEYHWFNSNDNSKIFKPKYDVVYIGQNIGHSHMNPYASFKDDYYETFRWLADFSTKNPHLKIGIKHHQNNKIDEKEKEIIKDSHVERIDQKVDSYKVIFQSKCALTFGSTMGYELFAHDLPVLFLDPGKRNPFLPESECLNLYHYRVCNYQDFNDRLGEVLFGKPLEGEERINKDNLCMQSNRVSETIFSWFSLKGI